MCDLHAFNLLRLFWLNVGGFNLNIAQAHTIVEAMAVPSSPDPAAPSVRTPPQVPIMEGLIQMTDWSYTTAHEWLNKLHTHYQRPPLQKHEKTRKMIAPLLEYVIICSKLPFSKDVLRVKLNTVLCNYGYPCSLLDNLPFVPFEYKHRYPPAATQVTGAAHSEEGADEHVEVQKSCACHILSQPPWKVRIRTFNGETYFCASDIGNALGHRASACAMWWHLTRKEYVKLTDILPASQKGCHNKRIGQAKCITMDVVKKLALKSRMPEARALAEVLDISVGTNY